MSEGDKSIDQSSLTAKPPNHRQPQPAFGISSTRDTDQARDLEGDSRSESETLEVGRLRRTLERRERQITRLRYQLAVENWKLNSLRQRRWWRLGTELGKLRRQPTSVWTLPARLLRVIRNPTPRLPRPTRPPELAAIGASPSLETADSRRTLQPITPRHDVAALSLLGPELTEHISYEVQLFGLDLERWREQITMLAPRLLFVESFVLDEPESVEEVIKYAAANGIVTVLWDNGPISVPDDLKTQFDIVISKETLPADGRGSITRRGLVQPSIHNPIGAKRQFRSADIEFATRSIAGTTYRTLTELASASRQYEVLRSAGSAGIAELAPIVAAGTPVVMIGSHHVGIATHTVEEAEAMERSLLKSEVLRARLTHPQMRRVIREFSISFDVNELLNGNATEWPLIDVMVPTNRPQNLSNILDNLGRQTYPNFRVFLVAHGIDLQESAVREEAKRAGVRLEAMVHVPGDVILGEVLNIGFGETEADIVAKIDDDDFYGAEYLWDLYSALDFSGAEVAGKWAHYAYLEGPDTMVYRYPKHEHRFTDVVAISTLLMRREVLEAERFPAMPWGSGSVFLRALGAQGGRVFAADRWNYLYIRGQDGERNTFPISDLKLLSISDVVCKGLNKDEVIV